MKNCMKKSLLAAALLTAIGISSQVSAAPVPIGPGSIALLNGAPTVAPGTYTLGEGVYVGGTYIQTAGPNNAQFTVNPVGAASEFRMVGTNGATGGGGEKSLVGIRDDGSLPDNGSTTQINWTVGNHPTAPLNGIVLGTDGDLTPGAANSTIGQAVGGTTNAIFFNQFFGFAGAYPWFVTVDYTANTIAIDTASIEAQWGNQFFPMGLASAGNQCNTDGQGCGIHFGGTISNVVGNNFDFTLFGEHRVTDWEDKEGGTLATGAGFAGWTAQFALQGHYTAVPVPAAVWLFGSGLLGLVGIARRKKKA